MSSPPPSQPPSGPMHNFGLPCDLKWSKKSRSTNSPTQGRGILLPKLSSSSSSSLPLKNSPSSGSSNQLPFAASSHEIPTPAGGMHAADKEAASAMNKMSQQFEKSLSFPYMINERVHDKEEEKPLKQYVRSRKKKLIQDLKDQSTTAPINVTPQEDKFLDMDAKLSSFCPRHISKSTLNLEKNVGSASKNRGKSIQENEKDKKFKEIEVEESNKEEEGPDKKKKSEYEKAKKKAAQEMEAKLPKFSVQLTDQEIADDLFAMTGSRPSRKPKKRPSDIQAEVDQLTPGLWLESIDAQSYMVNENDGNKGKRSK